MMEEADSNATFNEPSPPEEPMLVVSEPTPQGNKVTFMGNTYDLLSVVTVVSGGLTLLSCLTCNMGYYCLPILPIVLGIVGVLSAQQSVDRERTRLLSWLGVAAGGIILLLFLVAVALYVGFIVVMMVAGGFD